LHEKGASKAKTTFKMKHFITILIFFTIMGCNTFNSESVLYPNSMSFAENSPISNAYGKTVLERFDAPLGYTRVSVNPNTFSSFLRTLPLKPDGTPVHYYNGTIKPNNHIYTAVVDLPLSTKNVQHSPDAVVRLISEFFYQQKHFEAIAFHAEKEKISFTDFAKGDFSKQSFHSYLDYLMERMSTPSFCLDLKLVELNNINIGDIFVQNTLPNGHAVIVVDIVENRKGEKLFLLAQGFHPAQDIQIISNPNREDINPWYQLKEGELLTPEWRFMTTDLMRFKFWEP
jgi:hypothetical protein